MVKNYHLLLILFVIFIIYCESSKINNNEHLTTDTNQNKTDEMGFDLRNVQTMTFFKNKLTNGNRTAPISQLNCVGGNACNESNIISSVQCTNTGTNASNDVQWKCSTNLPNYLTMNNTNINCEGLKDSSDKIKLKESCGLEYNLDNNRNHMNLNNSDNSYIIIIFVVLFIIVFVFALVNYVPHSYYYNGYNYPGYYFGIPYHTTGFSYNTNFASNFGKSNDGFGTTITR